MEWLTKVITMLKLPIKLIFVVFLATSFFLFTPQSWQQNLNIINVKEKLGPFLGIVFVFCFFILLIEIGDLFRKQKANEKKKRNILKKIDNEIEILDADEKSIIREFFIQEKNAIDMPIDEPSVSRLITKGILVRVGDFADLTEIGILSPVSIAEEVRNKLVLTQIDFKGNSCAAEKVWMENNRPLFIKQIQDQDLGF